MVYKCDCMGYLVSNAGCEGMSLFIMVREELIRDFKKPQPFS